MRLFNDRGTFEIITFGLNQPDIVNKHINLYLVQSSVLEIYSFEIFGTIHCTQLFVGFGR